MKRIGTGAGSEAVACGIGCEEIGCDEINSGVGEGCTGFGDSCGKDERPDA